MQLSDGTRSAPAGTELAHIDTWIFDLDNTLYPSSSHLFDQVSRRIGDYIATVLEVDRDEAGRLQKGYFREYGTTLRGLMLKHGMKPAPFLEFVHDIDLAPIARSDELEAALGLLPGRKLVFTNADAPYARRVMARLGIGHHFSGIHDIEAADWVPKPFPGPMSCCWPGTPSTPHAQSCSRTSCATWRRPQRSAWPPCGCGATAPGRRPARTGSRPTT